MSTPTNGTGNLVDEFEESFLILMQVLAKEEENYNGFERDETRIDIEQATQKFLDNARQVESFFLQKRFVLSVLKPELIVKEEILDLKHEIQKKDELLKKHYEKITHWQTMLLDAQNWNKSSGQGNLPSGTGTPGSSSQGLPTPSGTAVPPGNASPNPAVIAMQQQIQQQQQQHQQQQQAQQQQIQVQQQQVQQLQMQQQQQQMSVGIAGNSAGAAGSMMSPQQQAIFMQQQQQQQGMGQRPAQFASGQAPGNMLNPLAFLEKTTSNIGMPDGRR